MWYLETFHRDSIALRFILDDPQCSFHSRFEKLFQRLRPAGGPIVLAYILEKLDLACAETTSAMLSWLT